MAERRVGRMAIAPLLKSGGRKPLQVRVLHPPLCCKEFAGSAPKAHPSWTGNPSPAANLYVTHSTRMKLELKPGNALVLVAHPDDETIWMGGTILKFPNVRWTIFSLCRAGDRERAPKFRRACRLYAARPIISDLEDEGAMSVRESVPAIERRIRALLTRRRFDFIFTHGYNGEYGHPRHKGVARAVKRLAAAKWLTAKEMFALAYHLKPRGRCARPNANSDYTLALTKKNFEKKRRVINTLYGFRKQSFEYRSAAQKETFNRLII